MEKDRNKLRAMCLMIAVIGLIIFPSCSKKILDERPLDFLSPDNAYLTEAGALQGITAIHAEVRFAYYSFESYHTTMWACLGSDEGYEGEDLVGGTGYLNSYKDDCLPTSPTVVDNWNEGFKILQWANVLIDKVQKADSSLFEDGVTGKNKYIAEARFFRAWEYRFLVSTYGNIPLLTEPINTAKTDFVRDSVADIHDLMVEDFKFATLNLPRPGQEDAPGRITQGPAWHYLAETYLEQGKPQLAVEAATHAIDDYSYALMTHRFGTRLAVDIFGSGDPFYDLFGFGNHNLADNTEAMWVIQVEPFITGGGAVESAYFFGPRYFDLGLTPDGFPAFRGELVNGVYTGYSDTLSRPTAEIRGTSLIYYNIWLSDWNKDDRNAEHNIKRNFYYDSPGSIYDKKKIDFSLYNPARPDPLFDTCKILFPIHIKFTDPLHYFLYPNYSGSGITHKDWYALRFAETLLLRAEAYVDLNEPVLAAADINKVRERAHATPVPVADVNIDYVLDERARELYGEEWRSITLRRTGKLLERTLKYNDNPLCPGAFITAHNFRWPIPQAQIDLNISSNFPQNPGY